MERSGKELSPAGAPSQQLAPTVSNEPPEDNQFRRVPLRSPSCSASPLHLFPRSPGTGTGEAEARHRSPSSSPPPATAAKRAQLPFVQPGSLSSPADPPGCSPSVTFCAGAGGWLGWSESSPRGRGRRKVKPRERWETPFRTCVAGRARRYLFSPSLSIARAERRGEPGDMRDHPLAGKQRAAPPRPRAAERLLPPRSGDCPRQPRPRRAAAARPAAPQPRTAPLGPRRQPRCSKLAGERPLRPRLPRTF
ncbi:PREDICTED: uncharacterized protein LOC109396423 [Hipposideros armiger]|uniref:Uncharacterized protein LOC109396423 n=1 Tax=Hipposideros armiger TaxID=186990 RepID=A0A8B7TDE9_HIPAR|nr:PREDICTED: uncharacterized protein LOC109396423 [Hipposideros armiger]